MSDVVSLEVSNLMPINGDSLTENSVENVTQNALESVITPEKIMSLYLAKKLLAVQNVQKKQKFFIHTGSI